MYRVAIVDDHPISRAFLDCALRAEGFEPVILTNGPDAVRYLNKHDVDLWLIDWIMPGMSGVELVTTIRKHPKGQDAYIIMQTAKTSDDDVALALEAGANDYLRKPISGVELRARIGAALRILSTNLSLKKQVSEIQSLNDRLRIAAMTDELTELENRRAGLQKLKAAWEVDCAIPLSVALVDIDNFKKVNDTFGHARGDAAIRFVAMILREHIREKDTVARIGGEEFLLVLPGATMEAANAIIDRARSSIAVARCHSDGVQLSLAVSAGIAQRSTAMQAPEELLREADTALYAAKRLGGNRVLAQAA